MSSPACSSPSNSIRNCTLPRRRVAAPGRRSSAPAARTRSPPPRRPRWARGTRGSGRARAARRAARSVPVGGHAVSSCRCRGRLRAPLAGGPADLGLQGVQRLVGDGCRTVADQPVDVRRHRGQRRSGPARSSARGPRSSHGHGARLEQQPQVLADRRPADRTARGEVDDPARLDRPARPAASGAPGRPAPRRCPRQQVTTWLPMQSQPGRVRAERGSRGVQGCVTHVTASRPA